MRLAERLLELLGEATARGNESLWKTFPWVGEAAERTQTFGR